MSTTERWLQVRMTKQEKERLEKLAHGYGVTLSMMVRLMTSYFTEKQPVVTITTQHETKKVAA